MMEPIETFLISFSFQMSFVSELEKAWSKHPGTKGLPMPAGIATAESEARIERVKQEEIQRLIAANLHVKA
mgnify:FL=1